MRMYLKRNAIQQKETYYANDVPVSLSSEVIIIDISISQVLHIRDSLEQTNTMEKISLNQDAS